LTTSIHGSTLSKKTCFRCAKDASAAINFQEERLDTLVLASRTEFKKYSGNNS